jgi:hypothetical protein
VCSKFAFLLLSPQAKFGDLLFLHHFLLLLLFSPQTKIGDLLFLHRFLLSPHAKLGDLLFFCTVSCYYYYLFLLLFRRHAVTGETLYTFHVYCFHFNANFTQVKLCSISSNSTEHKILINQSKTCLYQNHSFQHLF